MKKLFELFGMIKKHSVAALVVTVFLVMALLGWAGYKSGQPVRVDGLQTVFYSVNQERPAWVYKAPAWVRNTGAKWAWVRNWSAVQRADSPEGVAALTGAPVELTAYGPCLVARLNGGLAVAWGGRWEVLKPAKAAPGLTPRTPRAARDYQAALAKR